MKKWKVRKRDGAWWVLDDRGRLLYASGNHVMALSFALMQPPKPVPFATFTADDLEIMRRMLWHKKQNDEDGEK